MELVSCNVRPVRIGVVHALRRDGMTLCGIQYTEGQGWAVTHSEVTCAMCLESMKKKPRLMAPKAPVPPELERAMAAEELAQSLADENEKLRKRIEALDKAQTWMARELNQQICELSRRLLELERWVEREKDMSKGYDL